MAIKYYWEDFNRIGGANEVGTRIVTKDEIIAFAEAFDPQPFHIDEAAAKASFYGGIIASGWHTCAMVMRMMVDSYLGEAASLGSPGIDNLKWIKPVRPGDTIRLVRTTLEARASESKPDVGLIKNHWQVYNQHDELVMSMEGWGMFRRRNPGAAA
ncbi:MAG: MaoC family dehydratase [Burkholderiales bacterium]